jgi:hypothetical protein
VVLQAQKDKEVDVLLHQVHATFVLNWRLEVLIGGEQDALSHEDFYDVEARGVRIHIEADRVEDGGFLGYKLVFTAVKS